MLIYANTNLFIEYSQPEVGKKKISYRCPVYHNLGIHTGTGRQVSITPVQQFSSHWEEIEGSSIGCFSLHLLTAHDLTEPIYCRMFI